jgi:hypothetical protein
MIVYSLISVTLLLGLLGLALIVRGIRSNKSREGRVILALGLSVAGFVTLYGAWVYIDVAFRWVYGGLALLMLAFALWPAKKAIETQQWRRRVNSVLSVWFILLDILFFTGTSRPKFGSADIGLPFKQGTYFVLQGGRGMPTNLVHSSRRNGTVFAMDIVKLNSKGKRAKKILSTDLQDYEIYKDTIYSPCDGIIAQTHDGMPDNVPPHATNSKANTLVIENPLYYICLVHLKPGGIFVTPGEVVKRGQPIGLVGNSGRTIEPHLHIQAHANTHRHVPWNMEEPLEIRFNGVFYNHFDQIKAEKAR